MSILPALVRDAHFFSLRRFDCVCQCQRPQSMFCVNLAAVATWFSGLLPLCCCYHCFCFPCQFFVLLPLPISPDPSADENFFPKPQTFPIKIILNAPTREYMTRKKFFRFFFFLRCYHKIFSSYRLLLALRFSLPHPMAWRSFISEVYSRLFIAYSVLVSLIHAPTANGENSCVSCVKKVLFMSNKITTEFRKVSLISVRFPK